MSRLKEENMEQDLLVEYSSRAMHFYYNNKAAVIGGILGVLIATGLIIGYFVTSANQGEQAQNLLANAEDFYRQGDLERALYGDDATLTPGFEQIAENYGRTSAGNLAHYYAAVIEYEMSNYERALEYIEEFNPPEGVLGVGPISFHGVLLTELGEYEQAATTFIQAANWNENNSTTPYNLMEAAIAFEEAGMTDDAVEQLDIILSDYPNSERAGEARRMRASLAAGR